MIDYASSCLYYLVGVVVFWRILFMAHLGYLQCLRTSSRCFNSIFTNSGVENTTQTLCVRVLITLYFYARLWLLSHWRYWSVWVGFLYTFVVKVPSGMGITKMSKDGMEPSGPASSTVNWKDVSTVLICWKNSILCDSSSATLYVTEPILDTMGLGGPPSYVFLGAHRTLVHWPL